MIYSHIYLTEERILTVAPFLEPIQPAAERSKQSDPQSRWWQYRAELSCKVGLSFAFFPQFHLT
jgi:hypothetical protein